MKVVIFAGGYGTRISEETTVLPKPLVEIGSMPILWHIMKIYSAHGLNDFVICCGYKGHLIKRYFLDLFHRENDMTIDLRDNSVEVHRTVTEPWKVTLADTGLETMTGGRLRRVRDYIGDEPFCLTYGDGVSDIDITALIEFHKAEGTLATVTAVQQPGRFGALDFAADANRVKGFREKSAMDGHLINGGFFVCEPGVIDYVDGDDDMWEHAPLRRIVAAGELSVYRHAGFWQNMDTLRDKHVLQELWDSGDAPWKIWDRPAARANAAE
ncbi:glucose-1-phosphate cytidylyltransferase [Amaricoccus solimangrovi]|uniref:Glucose-1-phosphate cytidylyltransferase n=1 Tax=Amaricoccus solimangrovi TaxID=2589815 RepID=A0A501WJX9_9RHOB|nr:glucose-1-phosphate cytidylyltransferase [Amaricoccus solimangrovi]TPE48404.1 glucose-1-phosphate cytidylyltransferase [Amaricoccus solimangrovi]